MPKKQRANYFNFSGGLDTDASILNRNPITVTDIDNCNLNTDGSITSRRGIQSGVLESAEVDSYSTYAPPSSVYEWHFKDDVGASITFQVLKTGNTISFYQGDEPIGTPELVVNTNAGNLDHTDIVFDGNIVYIPDTTHVLSFYILTVHKYQYLDATGLTDISTNSGVISYAPIVELEETATKVDDIRMVCSSDNFNVHPLEESNTVWAEEAPATTDTIPEYQFDIAYASGTKVKVTKGVFQIVTSGAYELVVGTHLKIESVTGTVYDTVRTRYESGSNTIIILENLSVLGPTLTVSIRDITTIKSGSDSMYPNIMETALGRLFLSTRSTSNTVYYSQIYTEDESLSHKCYSEANPFNTVDNVVVASDGGYFTVSGATYVIGIRESAGALIIFAENGVWEAVGAQGIFTADDFVVRKLTDKGCVSHASIERVEGGLVYVSNDGVNVVTKDKDTGLTSVVQSLTDNKIEEYFRVLPRDNKEVMSSTYNNIDKELYILFNDDTEFAPMIQSGVVQHFRNILIYKLKLGAWYVWSLSDDREGDKLSMSDIWMSDVNDSDRISLVDDATQDVLDDTGNTVTVASYTESVASTQPLVYLTKYNTGTSAIQNTYGKLLTSQVYDFEGTVDQEYNDPSFSSAHQTYSDLMRGKAANYIKVLYENLQDFGTDEHNIDILKGGCNLRVSLDTAESPLTTTDEFGEPKNLNVGYGVPYPVYPAKKPGYTHTMYKHKVLGRGNILQFNFSAETDQRFYAATTENTGKSPILDTDGEFWEEIAEDDLVELLEWEVDTTYSIAETCKVTHPNHFHIVGWSCEMIPTESVTSS